MLAMNRRAAIALGAAGGAVARCGPALAPVVPPVAQLLRIPRRLELTHAVAVTFDDGPHPQGTPAVLEILRGHGARATFFVVGEQIRRTGALLDEIRAEGHAIAVHGDRHRNLMRLSSRMLRTDLDRVSDLLGAAPLPVHRAPYGIYTLAALRELRRRGWRPLLWSRWGHDWRSSATSSDVATEASRDLAAGDVLLLHDADHYSARGSWRTTMAALPRILEAIAHAGLATSPVTQEALPAGSTAARTSGVRSPSR